MKKRTAILSALIGLMATSFNATAGSNTDEESVLAATRGFYDALNIMFTGDIGPITEVWSHADDVTYMGPMGGYEVGWADTLKVWEAAAAMKMGGTIKAVEMHVLLGKDLAVVQNYEKGSNTGKDGEIVEVSIRATNIFRKEAGKWKMISHHTDLLPFLEN